MKPAKLIKHLVKTEFELVAITESGNVYKAISIEKILKDIEEKETKEK